MSDSRRIAFAAQNRLIELLYEAAIRTTILAFGTALVLSCLPERIFHCGSVHSVLALGPPMSDSRRVAFTAQYRLIELFYEAAIRTTILAFGTALVLSCLPEGICHCGSVHSVLALTPPMSDSRRIAFTAQDGLIELIHKVTVVLLMRRVVCVPFFSFRVGRRGLALQKVHGEIVPIHRGEHILQGLIVQRVLARFGAARSS
jgi:hypothetical protein